MNERRTSTLCADNCFFSCSFHGFSRGDDSVAQRPWSRLLYIADFNSYSRFARHSRGIHSRILQSESPTFQMLTNRY